jgi:DNA-binding CsgD family transcriptional regulator
LDDCVVNARVDSVVVIAGSTSRAESVAANIPGAKTAVLGPSGDSMAANIDPNVLFGADVLVAADDVALSWLRRELPGRRRGPAGVLALVSGGDALARLGVRGVGWLPPQASSEQLIAAIAAVRAGLRVVAGGMPSHLAVAFRQRDEPDAEPLTGREHDVLALLVLGARNRAIAQRLGISAHTVKFHVASILGKLGVATRTQAVREALRRGLVTM